MWQTATLTESLVVLQAIRKVVFICLGHEFECETAQKKAGALLGASSKATLEKILIYQLASSET